MISWLWLTQRSGVRTDFDAVAQLKQDERRKAWLDVNLRTVRWIGNVPVDEDDNDVELILQKRGTKYFVLPIRKVLNSTVANTKQRWFHGVDTDAYHMSLVHEMANEAYHSATNLWFEDYVSGARPQYGVKGKRSGYLPGVRMQADQNSGGDDGEEDQSSPRQRQ